MGIRTIHNRTYGGIILGVAIRGRIGTDKIFRFRKGNGYKAGDEKDHYQDQYDYFVPTSITNVEGQAARDALTAGVAAWQALSEAAKQIYNDRASKKGLNMSGYNLYIGEYVRANA